MADPITATVGTVLGAVGKAKEGRDAEKAADRTADRAKRDAQIAQEQSDADILTLRKNIYRTIGAARAAQGASGFAMDGSILDVLADTVTEGELDVQRRQYQADLDIMGYKDRSKDAQAAASSARTGGYLGAASTLLKI